MPSNYKTNMESESIMKNSFHSNELQKKMHALREKQLQIDADLHI